MHLDQEVLEALLKTSKIGRAPALRNEVWETLDSTNVRALALASEDAPHGVFVAARRQTAGRGRLGRVWVSPPDSGLYISFILRPQLQVGALPIMSLAAGVAVARAINVTCGVAVGLKWVNDIVFGGRKVGGILCEMQTAASPALVVGIGINLRFVIDDLPPDIQVKAHCLEDICGAPVDPNLLASTLCFELERAYDNLHSDPRAATLEEWKRHSVTLGQEVRATIGGAETMGVARDLAADGALIIEKFDGECVTVHSGEVTIRKLDGSYV